MNNHCKKKHCFSQLSGGLLIKNTHSSMIKKNIKKQWHDFYTETPYASQFESYSWLCKNCFLFHIVWLLRKYVFFLLFHPLRSNMGLYY